MTSARSLRAFCCSSRSDSRAIAESSEAAGASASVCSGRTIAFHPSGLHVLVGFEDKLRLCNVFMDDIRPFKEFPIKQCRECAFSRGGDMFAAVNGNVIQLYDAFTCANVGNLRGHGGKVRSVSWTEDDAAIVSAGADGAVYEWRVKDLARCKENVQKGCEYQCAVAGFEGHAFAAGSDGAIREFDEPFEVAREFQEEAGAISDPTERAEFESALKGSRPDRSWNSTGGGGW